jgi:hypothetical protein
MMNTENLIVELADIAISLAQSLGDGTIPGDAAVAKTLLDIVERGIEVYNEHSGEPISLNQIRPEETL